MHHHKVTASSVQAEDNPLDAIAGKVIAILLAMFFAGMALTAAYYAAMHRFPKNMIKIALLAQILFCAAFVVLSIISGLIPAIVVSLVLLLLMCFFFYSKRESDFHVIVSLSLSL